MSNTETTLAGPAWMPPVLRRNGVAVAGLLVAGYVPFVLASTQLTELANTISVAIALLSLNVLLGYAGQISLGHAAFQGTGAFLTLQLAARGWPLPAAILVGALGVAAITGLIGLPSLRIKGLAVAIATLVYGVAAEKWLFNQAWFTGQDKGLFLDAPFTHADSFSIYLVALGFLLAVIMLDRQLLESKLGRAFVVTRDGEERAVAFGVEPGRTKLQAYALSGFLAGISGGLIVALAGVVSGADYGFIQSLEILAFAVLGGMGSRAGVIAAAFLLVGFPGFFPPPDARLAPLIGGILLIVVVLFLPDGFGGVGKRIGKWWRAQTKGMRVAIVDLGILLSGAMVLVHHGIRTAVEETNEAGEVLQRIPEYTGDTALFFALGALALLAIMHHLLAPADPRTEEQVEGDGALATGADAAARAKKAAANAVVVRDVPRELSLRMPTRVMFEATDVGVRFGGVQALQNINLEVRQGEIVGLIGANGAGKSTFYNVVSGFVTPTPGSSLKYKGRELLDFPASVRTRWGVARTFQHMGLIRDQSVEDNVLLAQHWLADYDSWLGTVKLGGAVRTEAELRMRAELALEIFGLEQHRGDRLGSLSYGTMRMVELASAVASGSDLLFFDEASAGLAPTEAHALGDRFLALRQELGLTMVVIEHHVPLIARTCDYVYCLASGRQLAEGEPASVQTNPEVIAEFLGRSQIKKTTADDVDAARPKASDTKPTRKAATTATARKSTASGGKVVKKTSAKKSTAKKATAKATTTASKATATKKATAKRATKKVAKKVAKKSTRGGDA